MNKRKHISKREFLAHGWTEGECIVLTDGNVYPVVGVNFANETYIEAITPEGVTFIARYKDISQILTKDCELIPSKPKKGTVKK